MPSIGRRRPAQLAADPTDAHAARESALRLLERVRRTRSELARRLAEKGYEATTIARTIDRLGEVGLVDDAEYARAYLASRLGRRSAGRKKLDLELRARGVSPDDIAQGRLRLGETTDAAAPGDTGAELTAARRVLDQAARRYASLDPRTRRQRLTALLMRRGFDFDTIQAAMTPVPETGTDD